MNFSDVMEKWLSSHETVDKDKTSEKYEQSRKMNSASYVKDLPVDATLDLHGLTRDEAWNSLEIFTGDCLRRGFKKILIIHGKGNHGGDREPVLGDLVRLFIERNPHLGASGHPDRTQGGSGATWVIIKK
ncbi:Smr/MutS family protein [Treponema sp.]|uniref:Smr/MutS family protein n=1 Tax=Treponema sp. TaxID=166 RepID=UPI00298ECC3D|nr:Smr/MutS family protein [Treponema sp.]MCR5613811.1 Smr/MutS family protein [Treponema sp.]